MHLKVKGLVPNQTQIFVGRVIIHIKLSTYQFFSTTQISLSHLHKATCQKLQESKDLRIISQLEQKQQLKNKR
jgi:hypothetical protein